MHFLRSFWFAVTKGVSNTINHDGIEHAGYLAFLGLLAMFPFLVFLAALVGVAGQGEIGAEFTRLLFNTLPPNAADALAPRVQEIVSGPPQGLLTISILGAIWTASSAVEGLRTTLNRAYHVGTPPAYIWRRLLSIAQFVFFTFILIIGMLLLITAPLIGDALESVLHIRLLTEDERRISQFVFAGTVFTLFLVVSGIYYIIPNTRLRFINVAPGAAIVVLLWLGAAKLFTMYLANFNQVNLIYGSLGGIIAALVFFYISNMIFIFGAEFNYLLSRSLGYHFRQAEPAAPSDHRQ